MELLGYVTTAVFAYLLGSIPTGFLVAQAKGVDIRSVGSGNIGATNVFRILGKQAGILVLLVDALKGWAAVVLLPRVAALLWPLLWDPASNESLGLVAGLCAIIGHNYTCWLYFKGGKGIATSAGVLAALVPWALLIILALWIAVFALTRYVSLASVSASFALPFAALLTRSSRITVAFTGAMAALAIYKHRANIQRLFQGTENRFRFRGKEATK